MAFSINVIKITILIVTWLCGSILNSSIVAVYLRDWKNRIILGECEWTILTIGCTNILMQCLLTISETIVVYELYGLFFKEFYVVGSMVFFSLTYSSMWLSACLSICYCMKLLNISHNKTVQFHRGLSSKFLFGSVMVSCLINVPFIWTTDTELLQNTTLSADNSIYKQDIIFMLFNVVVGCCVPVLVTSLCIGLCVMFLLKHVQRMKNNTFQSWNLPLKSHMRACRTMSFLLILNLFFFLTVITLAMGLMYLEIVIVSTILYWSVIITKPSAEAIILIFGNTKLKMALHKIFLND